MDLYSLANQLPFSISEFVTSFPKRVKLGNPKGTVFCLILKY